MSVDGPPAGVGTGAGPGPGPGMAFSACAPRAVATIAATASAHYSTRPPFAERQRLLGALRERAAAAAKAACALPPEAATDLQVALADEHCSLLRCLNLLEESGGDERNAIPALVSTPPEVSKPVTKRPRKLKTRKPPTEGIVSTLSQEKSLKPAQRRCKSPTSSQKGTRPKITNASREGTPTNYDIPMKQRKSIRRQATGDNNQKTSSSYERNQKALGDRRKKSTKQSQVSKFKARASSPKNTSRTSPTREFSPRVDKKSQGKQRQTKTSRGRMKESLETALTPYEPMPNASHRAGGDVAKKGTKQRQVKHKKAVQKSIVTPPVSNSRRKTTEVCGGRKSAVTHHRGIKKLPTPPDQRTFNFNRMTNGELQLLCNSTYDSNRDIIIEDNRKIDEKCKGEDKNGARRLEAGDLGHYATMGMSPTTINSNIRNQVLKEGTCPQGIAVQEPTYENPLSQTNPTAPEGTEICLRSILRDTNKKLVSLGNKTVRFHEDTLPKKNKKRKAKNSKKINASEKAVNKKVVRNNSSNVSSKGVGDSVVGYVRVAAVGKNPGVVKNKKRIRTIEVKVASHDSDIIGNNSEIINAEKDSIDVEKTFTIPKRSLDSHDVHPVKPEEEVANEMRSYIDIGPKSTIQSSRVRNEEVSNLSISNTHEPKAKNDVASPKTLEEVTSSRTIKRKRSIRKSLCCSDVHVPNSPVLRMKRKFLNDMTNRYSSLLAGIYNKNEEKVTPSESNLIEKCDRPSIHSVTSEDVPRRRSTLLRKRPSLSKKEMSATSRDLSQAKISYQRIPINTSKKGEEEKIPSLGNARGKSVSQTSMKYTTSRTTISDPNFDSSASSRNRLARTLFDHAGIRKYQKPIDVTKRTDASRQKASSRALGSSKDARINMSRSVSTTQSLSNRTLPSREAKTPPEQCRVNENVHQMNIRNSIYNWSRQSLQDATRRYSTMDANILKLGSREGLMNRSNSATRTFTGRTTRRKLPEVIQPERPNTNTSQTSATSDGNMSDATITSADFNTSTSRSLNLDKCPLSNNLTHIPSATDLPTIRQCRNCTSVPCWQHTPTLKYLFQAYSKGLPGSPNNKKFPKVFTAMSKTKGIDNVRSTSGVSDDDEDDESKTINNSERSDASIRRLRNRSAKSKKQKSSNSRRNSNQKNDVSSEVDEDNSSRRSQRPIKIKTKLKKEDRKTAPGIDRSTGSRRQTRSQSCQPPFVRQRSSIILTDGRSSLTRPKSQKQENSFSRNNTYSSTSLRRSNTRDQRITETTHGRVLSGTPSRISNNSRLSTRQSSRSKIEERQIPQTHRGISASHTSSSHKSQRKYAII